MKVIFLRVEISQKYRKKYQILKFSNNNSYKIKFINVMSN
jgi:hypothetical protein